jgi:hypothetical protein
VAAETPGAHGRARPRARAWAWTTIAATGGAIAAAVALAPPASAGPGTALTWLLFTGSSTHVAATGWFYTARPVRAHMRAHLGRYLWLPLGLVAGAAVLAAMLSPRALQWGLLGYFAWQFFHYQKQNLGLAALAAAAHQVPPLTRAERRALIAAGLAGVAGLLAHPGLLQLTVRPGLARAFPLTAAVFAAAACAGLWQLARRPPAGRPAGLCAMYVAALGFWVPVFAFGSPYAAVAGLTIAHGLQYLVLTGLVAGGGGRGRQRVLPLAALGNIALIGGALLAAASHLHSAAPGWRVLYGGYLGVVMAHFVIDGGLWRMRDRFPRSFLAARLPYLLPRVQPAVQPGSEPAARPGARPAARAGASAPVPSAGDIR